MQKELRYIFFLFFAFDLALSAFSSKAQQLKLGNNPTQINKAAVLELQSWNQGLRLTRGDTTAVNAIISGFTAAQKDSTNGMIIFQISDSSIYLYTGGWWRKLAIADSLGIVSLNGLTNHVQTFDVSLGGNVSGFDSDPLTGVHTLKIAGASTGVVGVVTEGQQTWDGQKTFKVSPGIQTLTPGSVVFIGNNPDDTLAEDNDNFYWDNENKRLGIGTNTPGYNMDVNGTGRFTGSLQLEKDLIANGASGIDGQVLRSRGAGISPTWESLALDSLSNVSLTTPVGNGDILSYNGTNWTNTSGTGTFWSLQGNNISSGDFLGTTNSEPLIFKAGGDSVGYLGTGSAGQPNVVLGYKASAANTNSSSVVLGENAKSNSQSSIAIGENASAVGTSSRNSNIAIGNTASAYKNWAVALGIGTQAGEHATAIGGGARAVGDYSTAIGYNAYAWNNNTIILGDTAANKVNVGIGTNKPGNTLEINSGKTDSSGVTFSKMNASSSVSTGTTGLIGVDESGKVVRAGVQRAFSYPTRSFNTSYQISLGKDAFVTYTIEISVTQASLSSSGQIGKVSLEVKPVGASGWTTVSTISLTSDIALSILGGLVTLSLDGNTITQQMVLSGWIPKGAQVQLVKSGDATITYINGQEATME